jgi:hypothetical protein
MQVITHGTNPKLGLFSGIHGEEWGIISSVKNAILTYRMQLDSFLYIPECSPSAVKRKTRLNEEGIDLNRNFTKNPQSKEVRTIISQLAPYTFDTCVDFHEDDVSPGTYMYDSENIEGSDALTSFRQQVTKITSLYSGVVDEADDKVRGVAHEGYRVTLSPQKDSQGNYIYEGFFDYWAFIEGKTKRWMTLEVPIGLRQSQKDAVVDIFFRTFLLNNSPN